LFRFSSLGSGSRGNATLVQSGSTCVMLDCGFSEKQARQRLEQQGLEFSAVSAIVVTHEHSDHINGVGAVARKHNIPVYMTRGTAAQGRHGEVPQLNLIDVHDRFEIGDIELQAYPVPHDAREPVQFTFSDGAHRLAILTDTGSSTPHIEQMISGCHALMLECNHDKEMLANGPYPERLKQRVGGRYGHLSNCQSREILASLDTSLLQHIVAAHISDKNNTAEKACQALAEALDCHTSDIARADQDTGLEWYSIDN